MDVAEQSPGVVQRASRVVLLLTRRTLTLARYAYDVVIFKYFELTPGGKVRLGFLIYLFFILTVNYLSTIGMTSSPELVQFLKYNISVTKLSLSYVAGYMFVTFVNKRMSPLLTHLAIMVIPSMFICLLEEEVLWKSYRITFVSFVFLTYLSRIVPRKDSMRSIGPVTVIVSMSSLYLSLLMYIVPMLAPWQGKVCHMSWYFGIMLASSGLIMDDLQVVMSSTGFPVGLIKKRVQKYAIVIFAYYLVLFYSVAKLLSVDGEALPPPDVADLIPTDAAPIPDVIHE